MDRTRLCKKCRVKFTFDDVKSAPGSIARYIHDGNDVGMTVQGIVFCAKCLKVIFDAEGIKLDVKDLAISRWYVKDALAAITWDKVEIDGFIIVRAFADKSKFSNGCAIEQKIERNPTRDAIMATEKEALENGMLEVDPQSFAGMLGR